MKIPGRRGEEDQWGEFAKGAELHPPAARHHRLRPVALDLDQGVRGLKSLLKKCPGKPANLSVELRQGNTCREQVLAADPDPDQGQSTAIRVLPTANAYSERKGRRPSTEEDPDRTD